MQTSGQPGAGREQLLGKRQQALPGTLMNEEAVCASPLAERWQWDKGLLEGAGGTGAAEEGRPMWTSAEGAMEICLAVSSVTCLGDIHMEKVRGHRTCGTCLQGQGRAGW